MIFFVVFNYIVVWDIIFLRAISMWKIYLQLLKWGVQLMKENNTYQLSHCSDSSSMIRFYGTVSKLKWNLKRVSFYLVYRLLFVAKHNQRILVHAVFVPRAGAEWYEIRYFDIAHIRMSTCGNWFRIEHTR